MYVCISKQTKAEYIEFRTSGLCVVLGLSIVAPHVLDGLHTDTTAKDAETYSLQEEARNSQYPTPLNNNADTCA